jgi:MFS family permease
MAPSLAYRRYLLILLTAIFGSAFIDRMALGVLLQDIKVDLELSDTQLGFLSGIAFALFYSVMGIPIARWIDRGNRILIISLTAALWSIAVGLCGVAGGFAQLMAIRVGVAVGEAGAFPSGISLIADYFNRSERPRAVAIYSLGAPLAMICGYLIAGWLNQLYGWRLTFVLIGAPGLLLAAAARLTLREPRLAAAASGDTLLVESRSVRDKQPGLRVVWTTLWTSRTFRNLLLCISITFFFVYGNLQWQPSYFIRSFGLTSGQVGAWFAVIFGVGGVIGTYVGGELATRYAAGNERLQLVALALAMISCGVLSALVFLCPSLPVALGLLTAVSLAINVSSGPLYATIQTLAPERMRAVAMALVMLFGNLIGMGFGPLATGALSDAFHGWAADESLRYALLAMSPGYLLVAWFAWRASRTVMRDLAASRDTDREEPALLMHGHAIGLLKNRA